MEQIKGISRFSSTLAGFTTDDEPESLQTVLELEPKSIESQNVSNNHHDRERHPHHSNQENEPSPSSTVPRDSTILDQRRASCPSLAMPSQASSLSTVDVLY